MGKYVICFSGGRSSALMLYKMLPQVKSGDAIVVFNNTGKEREETLQFVENCSKHWGILITWLEYANDDIGYKIVTFETASRAGEPFAAAIDKKGGFLPNRVMRYCTEFLKIKPTHRYIKNIGWGDAQKAVGIRYDEPKRWANNKDNYLPLYKDKVTKKDVRLFWATQPFDLGLKDYEGNCDLCFQKGKRKLLTLMLENPAAANWWVEQEDKIGGRFLKEGSIAMFLKMSQQNKFTKALDYFDVGQLEFEDFDDSIGCFCGD